MAIHFSLPSIVMDIQHLSDRIVKNSLNSWHYECESLFLTLEIVIWFESSGNLKFSPTDDNDTLQLPPLNAVKGVKLRSRSKLIYSQDYFVTNIKFKLSWWKQNSNVYWQLICGDFSIVSDY